MLHDDHSSARGRGRLAVARLVGSGSADAAACPRVVVAVISDTHIPRGNRRLPEACSAHLSSADLILHGGDLASAAFLAELRSFGPPVNAVHGNVDEPALHRALPERRVVSVGEWRVGIVHDAGPAPGREARLISAFPGCAAIIYGHTHVPQIHRQDGIWILNPGSPTEGRRAASRTMIELVVTPEKLIPRLIEMK